MSYAAESSSSGMNAAWVWLFWSELPAGEGRPGRRRLRAHPGPSRLPGGPLPPRSGRPVHALYPPLDNSAGEVRLKLPGLK